MKSLVRTFARKVTRGPTKRSPVLTPKGMPPGMFNMPDENDPQMQEAMKQMGMFDKLVKGSDFEKKLDEFFNKQMEAGVDPEDILKNAMIKRQ